MSRREKLGPLAERPFRLLWLGQATSTLGDALVPVALSFAVVELTGSPSDLGLVLAAHIVPLVSFVLVGGVWADRLPRQLVMLGSDTVRGAAQAAIAVLLLSGAAELWHLIALTALYGAAEAFFQPAATGLVPSTVSPPRLQQANALLGMTRSTGWIAGPALAGVIVAFSDPGVAFALDAATFCVSVIFLAQLRIARAVRAERRSFLADLAGGWRELAARTWLWATILWATTYLLVVVAPFLVLGPFVAEESLGGAKAWGSIMASSSLGALGGGLLALRWKPERPLLVCCSSVLLAAPSPALLALEGPAGALAASQLVSGVAMGFFTAVWATTLQQQIPPDKLSRVSSYDWMGSFLFMPVGYVVAGPLSEAIGVPTTLWISTGWVVVSTVAVLLVPGVRELRRRPDAPEPEPLPRLAPPLEVRSG